MNYLGIDYSVKNMPALDPGFIPFGIWAKAYLKEADHPFKIAVERDHGKITVYETRLRGEAFAAANIRFAERLVKMLLYKQGKKKSGTKESIETFFSLLVQRMMFQKTGQ